MNSSICGEMSSTEVVGLRVTAERVASSSSADNAAIALCELSGPAMTGARSAEPVTSLRNLIVGGVQRASDKLRAGDIAKNDQGARGRTGGSRASFGELLITPSSRFGDVSGGFCPAQICTRT